MANLLLEGELLAACSSLGFNDGAKYHKEAECLEIIKDIIRYLRKDDDSHHIRRALGQTKVLQTDLIPIIKYHSDDKELFDVTLRLLVNMTTPVLLIFNEELPEEKITRQQFLLMGSHQQAYKAAFADEEVWNVLLTYLGNILNDNDRDEDDTLIVERILILIRNILSVAGSPEEEKRTDDDASIHDQVLWALHSSGLENLLMYIGSTDTEQDFCMHTLEIIYLMLREQKASQLAQAGLQRSQSEKDKDDKELAEMRKREEIKKQQKFKSHFNSRHSRFGGTYYVKNMKSISDKDLICHKQVADVSSLNFDLSKRPKRVRIDKRPLEDFNIYRRSTLAVRLFLQEFCIEFLHGAYNNIMYRVKDNLKRAKAQEHDESYYFWSMKFFLEFNRNHNFKIELISESICAESFHYIQMQIDTYYETMTTDKKKIPALARRMHKALAAYKELLLTLDCMDKNASLSVREASKVLKSKLFYVVEYRELLLILLQNFNELTMTKSYLKDLIETNHIYLKLLEGFCGKQKHLIVQKKQKNIRKKSKKKKKKSVANSVLSEEELNTKWMTLTESIRPILQDDKVEINPLSNPYDPVSEVPEELQKEKAMKKINALLRREEISEALSLVRASREIWPEGDIFGGQGMDVDQELQCLQIIFMANINDPEEIEPQPVDVEDSSESESEEDEMQQSMPRGNEEQELNLSQFIRRFAHTKVMQAFSHAFKDFLTTNSETTNHAILKMFHRLAWDSKLVAIFFQISLFRVFQQILKEPKGLSKQVDDAMKFIKFIIKKFFEIAETNDKVFVELLFWKTNTEALEIECGYDGVVEGTEASTKLWSEEEDDELRRLYEEFKDKNQEKDVVDLILENLIRQDRTRKGIIKKLKQIGLVENTNQLTRKSVKTKIPKEWTEIEEEELKYLVSEYLDTMNPIARIIDMKTVKRPKHRVIDKILSMGLVADKKELQKKRVKNGVSRKKKNDGEKFLAANRSNSDESDSRNSSESDSSDEETEEPIAPIKPTPELVKSTISKVLEEQRSGLEWLKDLLKDTADEREQDGDFEPIPLLAVTSDCSDALEDEGFQNFLRIIGIRPPLGHQEMFWRIPSNLSIDMLRKRHQYINEALEGKLEDSTLLESLTNEASLEMTESSKKIKKKSHKKSKSSSRPANHRHQSSSDEDSDEPLNKFKNKVSDNKRSLSEDESLDEQSVRNKSRIINNEDDDSDLEETVPYATSSLPANDDYRSSSDESEEPLSELKNKINSSKRPLSEDENLHGTSEIKKQRRIIHDEDDDSDREELLPSTDELPKEGEDESSISIKLKPEERTNQLLSSGEESDNEHIVSMKKKKPQLLISDDSDSD